MPSMWSGCGVAGGRGTPEEIGWGDVGVASENEERVAGVGGGAGVDGGSFHVVRSMPSADVQDRRMQPHELPRCEADWCYLCGGVFSTTEEHYDRPGAGCYGKQFASGADESEGEGENDEGYEDADE